MRLFIAVDPGERFRLELATRLDSYRRQLRINWVRPTNWHVTLSFLGKWSEKTVPALQNALQQEAMEQPPGLVTPGAVGAFPNLRRPRVLFLQMESVGMLERLAAGIRRQVDLVAPAGPQDRKPFRSHLTLARVKRPLPAAQRELPVEMDLGTWTPLPVTEFKLIRSELRPEGPRYTELAVLPLTGAV
ncbi:MAG: RNA 2',3'-cyclic phosphodiesterase [bacterium]